MNKFKPWFLWLPKQNIPLTPASNGTSNIYLVPESWPHLRWSFPKSSLLLGAAAKPLYCLILNFPIWKHSMLEKTETTQLINSSVLSSMSANTVPSSESSRPLSYSFFCVNIFCILHFPKASVLFAFSAKKCPVLIRNTSVG